MTPMTIICEAQPSRLKNHSKLGKHDHFCDSMYGAPQVLRGDAIFPSRIVAQTQEYIQKHVQVFEKCYTRPITVTVFLDIWNLAAKKWDFGWLPPKICCSYIFRPWSL